MWTMYIPMFNQKANWYDITLSEITRPMPILGFKFTEFSTIGENSENTWKTVDMSLFHLLTCLVRYHNNIATVSAPAENVIKD